MIATRHYLLAMVLMLLPSLGFGQGMLVDVRPGHHFRMPRPGIWPPRPAPRPNPASSYQIEKLAVQANLDGQVAKVQVSQSFLNTGSNQMEVSFVFPLPYDGAIDRLTLLVDGKEYAAKLLSADEARKIYEGYVRRNRDPALLEWIGTGMFKTSVFPVPAGARRTVTLRYTQLCRKTDGLTEWLFPLTTARYTSKPIDTVSFDVSIRSQVPIKSVYSPTHEIQVKRPSNKTARVTWTDEHALPADDFHLLYDVGDQAVGASVLSYRPDADDEGYFLLLVSPDIKPAHSRQTKKTVVFVVDKSGSMSGKKIEQARGALKFVLNNLNDGDLFNIIAYDSDVESFQPELQRLNEQTRKQSLEYVEGIYAGGSTNIDGALATAMNQLQDNKQPSYLVFLTDGLPTAGERNEAKIVANAGQRNQVRARMFPFGVGYDVNSRLLDKLARTCFGQSQYVRPNEDIEARVAQLYQRISAPVLVNMKIKFAMQADSAGSRTPVSRVYPKEIYDLFAGSQLVLAGRYKNTGKVRIQVSGTVDEKPREFEFTGKFVKQSKDQSMAYVEKLWAIRRIGEIIDEIDLHGKNQELVDELVALATRHGILTPYTSFLADDQVNVRDVASNQRRAGVALRELGQTSGASAFYQRMAKGDLQRANSPTPALSHDAFGMPGSSGMGMSGPLPQAGPGAPLRGRAMGGMGAMGGGVAGAAMPGGVPSGFGAGGKDKARPVTRNKVLQIGAKTFYWHNNRWEDSVLTEKQIASMQKIESFSDAYFKLVNQQGRSAAKYLAVDQPLVVVLNGTAYSFTPAP